MRIANPIYDVVFKYLMNDNKIARLIISALTELDVVDVEVRPTEFQSEVGGRSLLVYRIDFAAKVRTADGGHKIILIEIQKAKFHSDIMRFRRYLGEQYAHAENVHIEVRNEREYKVADPILTIYILGHRLEHFEEPVIRIKRNCYSAHSGELLTGEDEFIESLTHDSVIIQIPCLKEKRRNDLERLLSVFDQSHLDPENRHYIQLDEDEVPACYRQVFRRLIIAAEDDAVRRNMRIEDEYLDELEAMERGMFKALEEKNQAENRANQAENRASEAEREAAISKAQFEQSIQVLAKKLNITYEAAKEILDNEIG